MNYKGKLLTAVIGSLMLLGCSTELTAKNAKTVTLDFDSSGEKYTLHGGTVTKDKNKIIAGKASILADSRDKNKKWFEFFTTNAGLIAGNYSYRIKLKYRVLKADKGAMFYSLLRSKGKGWGKYDLGWHKVTNITPGSDQFDYTVNIGDRNDYELMLGIKGNAEVVVDNIELTPLKPFKALTEAEQIMARIPAVAKKNAVIFDFEPNSKRQVKFIDGKITQDKAKVLTGKQSVAINTMNNGKVWNNVLKLPPGLLKAGNRYYVTLKYTMHNKTGKAKVYMLARSTKFGPGSMDRGMRMSSGVKGEQRTMFTVFDIWQANDYCLEVGVKGQAEVSIDDIIIRHENLGRRKITQRQPLDKTKAKLVFTEDFNGTKINQKRWNISGDQERRGGLWLKQCAYLDGKGHLVLEFKKDKKSGKFAMGAVNTAGKFTVKYGYIEARVKVGREVGHWPGVWLTAKSTNQVGDMGRDGTEIDIVELPWRHKDEASHALHWDGYNEDHSSVGNHVKVPGINQGWHTYAVDWSPDGYIFFVDGKETWRTDAGDVCRVPLHLLLSDEMGGWSGNPNNAKKLPDFTYVDYIKVWQ